MITIEEMIRLLNIENQLIHDQTENLTQEDTLIQPQPGGNCMNWVLGHMLKSQISVLLALGGEPPIDPEKLSRYRGGSEPVKGPGEGVWTLDDLLVGFDQVNTAITNRLGLMSDTDFDVEIQHGDKRVKRSWRVFFLNFHHAYHIGQLEILRNLAGKLDKIV